MMLRFLLSLISILPLLSIADTPYEERVAAALMQLEEQDVSASLSELEALIEDYPNSKLGHLLWADLLAASWLTRLDQGLFGKPRATRRS